MERGHSFESFIMLFWEKRSDFINILRQLSTNKKIFFKQENEKYFLFHIAISLYFSFIAYLLSL